MCLLYGFIVFVVLVAIGWELSFTVYIASGIPPDGYCLNHTREEVKEYEKSSFLKKIRLYKNS
jgi:hypothetical protein